MQVTHEMRVACFRRTEGEQVLRLHSVVSNCRNQVPGVDRTRAKGSDSTSAAVMAFVLLLLRTRYAKDSLDVASQWPIPAFLTTEVRWR